MFCDNFEHATHNVQLEAVFCLQATEGLALGMVLCGFSVPVYPHPVWVLKVERYEKKCVHKLTWAVTLHM